MMYRWILIFLMLPAIALGQIVQSGGAGETNVLSDTGTFNGTEGFGLAGGKTGVALKVKGLIEGSNITITISGDSALVITASGGSGVWTERSDTLFAVDADGDTVAALWDDDAGNVRWQVATEDQTLRLLLDSLGIGGDLIAEFAGAGLTVTSNELTIDNDAIGANELKDSESPSDEEIVTYEETGTQFEYHTPGELALMEDEDINTFSELQSWVSNKTLVNEEDAFTIDANWVNTANPWAVNEVHSDLLTASEGDAAYQPLEATLTDIADGIIDENLDNTIEPWAANEIVSTVIHNDEMDASSELLAIMDDETGTGVLVFATAPTFTTDITVPLVIGGTATTSDLSLKTTSGVGATGADMHFLVGDNGATEAMTILNNGRVGIGINSPSSIFHIKADVPGTVGSHPAGQLIIQNPTNSVYGCAVITGYESDAAGNPDQQLWYLGSSSSSNSNIIFLNRRNSKLELGTNGVSRMTIDGGGYVGIGTASPPERLSVVGNIATGDTAAGDVDVFHYFSTDGSWVTEYLKWDDGVGRFEISDDFDIGGNLTLSGTATLATIAGAIDAGGATSFEIPAVDNPTTDAEGEIAWDTNDDAIEVYSGDEGESGLIPFYRHIGVALVLPDSVQTYTPDLFIFHVNALMYPFGIEIDLVSIQLEADAAYSMLIEEWTGADPPVYQNAVSTVTTGGSDTYAEEAPDNDGNLDAGDWLVLDIPTTDVDVVTVEIFFHVTEGN